MLIGPTLTDEERVRHDRNELAIERGLKTFYDVGMALLDERDNRLYRESYGTFEDYCEQRWNLSRRRAYQLLDAANIVEDVKNFSHPPERESHAAELVGLEPNDARTAWEVALDTEPDGGMTAKHIGSVVDSLRELDPEYRTPEILKAVFSEMVGSGTPIMQSSKSNEWYTPSIYIEAAREVMGSIDTDPASNDFANLTIRASTYYTIETNGLERDWFGNVWLNPPYGGLAAAFVERLVQQYEEANITQAILLVNSNSNEAGWFQPLFDHTLCFTLGRINFESPEPVNNQATHGSCFVYLGARANLFARVFARFGNIVRRWEG